MVTAIELAGFAGVILSLALSYIPGLNGWYAQLDAEKKRLLMLGLLVLTSAAVFGLSCAGAAWDVLGLRVTCDQAGLIGLGRAFLAAVIANQAAFLLSPKVISARRQWGTKARGHQGA